MDDQLILKERKSKDRHTVVPKFNKICQIPINYAYFFHMLKTFLFCFLSTRMALSLSLSRHMHVRIPQKHRPMFPEPTLLNQ